MGSKARRSYETWEVFSGQVWLPRASHENVGRHHLLDRCPPIFWDAIEHPDRMADGVHAAPNAHEGFAIVALCCAQAAQREDGADDVAGIACLHRGREPLDQSDHFAWRKDQAEENAVPYGEHLMVVGTHHGDLAPNIMGIGSIAGRSASCAC